MLAELRTKSQITLPRSIVTSLGLTEGDKLDITERDGVIYMIPVTVYPRKYLEDLHAEIKTLKADIKSGKQPVFDSIEALMEKLEEEEDYDMIAKNGKPVTKAPSVDTQSVSKRIGIAKGKSTVPDDFDAGNEEIATMLMKGDL